MYVSVKARVVRTLACTTLLSVCWCLYEYKRVRACRCRCVALRLISARLLTKSRPTGSGSLRMRMRMRLRTYVQVSYSQYYSVLVRQVLVSHQRAATKRHIFESRWPDGDRVGHFDSAAQSAESFVTRRAPVCVSYSMCFAVAGGK
jgi:hypothetical protein